jgi:hypothetical protein
MLRFISGMLAGMGIIFFMMIFFVVLIGATGFTTVFTPLSIGSGVISILLLFLDCKKKKK